MLRSMTGFGRAEAEADDRVIVIELKSVNHRYLDVAMRSARSLSFLETSVRAVLSEKLSRGHVDVYINYRNLRSDSKCVELDQPLLLAYRKAISDAAKELNCIDEIALNDIIRYPDVLNVVEVEDDREALMSLCIEATKKAADEMIEMRLIEGEKLAADLRQKSEKLFELITKIEERTKDVILQYRSKLQERIEELLSPEIQLDEGRLENEVAYFVDRANIDEELVRFRCHVEQFQSLLKSEEPIGRKIDFLVQEMNREINTIGSKSADTDISRIVVDVKSEIEKIREQIQNIE